MKFQKIENALQALRDGKNILVMDDETRENEGDLICAAQYATTENVNFMAVHAKEVAASLSLAPMVAHNTDNHETAFTVSIDHVDTTTGISAEERGFTARKCIEDGAKPEDFRRPGHMFPLVARDGGVLVRNGHTEATVDLKSICRKTWNSDNDYQRAAGVQKSKRNTRFLRGSNEDADKIRIIYCVLLCE